MSERGRVRGFFGSVARGLDLARVVVVNLVFLFLLVALVVWSWPRRGPRVPEKTALVLAPNGVLVEQLSGTSLERAVAELLGQSLPSETLARTVLEAIETAREDDRVEVLLLDLNRLTGGGLSKLQEIGEAIGEFKQAGKKVVATSDIYLQAQYYLAAQADEVLLHDQGLVVPPGYGSYRRYYKELLDRFDVDWNVFSSGEYKSRPEPFTRNDMSAEAREAQAEWLGDLWSAYTSDVEAARGLARSEIDAYVRDLPQRLDAARGNAAEAALAAGLIDEIAPRDRVRDRMIELVGEDEDTETFHQIDFRSYLEAADREERDSDNVVAVVVASGMILDGRQSPGTIGGDSTAELVRQARKDEKVKAVVLRVDSPGGSAFASEIIRREVELVGEAGKPVVVSMGSVAASGGYWISMTSDEIWASPTTITGSIGVYAMVPTFERTLERYGVRNDGVGTTWMAGTLRLDRSLPEDAKTALQLMTDQTYREFITKAAAGRGMEAEEVDRLARGRVWSGEDAYERGLVDKLGGLDEAIEAAAERAELGDDYRVAYVEPEPSLRERLLERFLVAVTGGVGPALRSALPDLPASLVREVTGDFPPLAGDPRGLWAHCFCDAE